MSKNVVPADFGGEGPRQVISEMLKNADTTRCVAAVIIRDNGEVEVWACASTPTDLSLCALKLQGYVLTEVMEWDTEED